MPISKKVVKALAELGKALEEEGLASSGDEWEKVSDVSPKASSEKKGYTHVAPSVCTGEAVEEKRPRSHQQLPVAPVFSGRATGSHVAYHKDIRCYVVLENPNNQASLGFWRGPSPQTWRQIERTLKNGELRYSNARLRRVQSLQEAEELWQSVHPGRKMPVVCDC